jgi:hypothetical protein
MARADGVVIEDGSSISAARYDRFWKRSRVVYGGNRWWYLLSFLPNWLYDPLEELTDRLRPDDYRRFEFLSEQAHNRAHYLAEMYGAPTPEALEKAGLHRSEDD